MFHLRQPGRATPGRLQTMKTFGRASLPVACALALLVLASDAGALQGTSAASTTTSAAAQSEAEGARELTRLVASLTNRDPSARKTAASAIENVGPGALPAIAQLLATERQSTTAPVVTLVKAARKDSGRGEELDLARALVETTSDAAGYRTATTTAVLAVALVRIGTTPAARQLVRVAGDHDGVFRPDLARHVATLGDKAVPALIEARKDPTPAVRHWASLQLEALGKRIAGDAVQTKDNQVLADVLHAFGNVHDVDALPVLLSFVSSDRVLVREAAREAVEQLGQDAITKLREAYSNVVGRPAPTGWTAPEVAKALFSAYDHLRLQEVYGLLDEGLARQREGKLDEAIAAFDRVLARQPLLDRRGEMVSAYVAHAESLEESDPPRAIASLRRAARLWPESPRVPHIEAELAYLEGKELLAHGVTDTRPFERALVLGPTHEKARAELTRLELSSEQRQTTFRYGIAGAVTLVVALGGFLLFGGRRRSRDAARA